MHQFLKLVEVPDMTTSDEELAKLDHLRLEPLAGERQMYWAIQSGSDVSTRQPLPVWMYSPISMALFKWLEQNRKWEDRIELRMREGKNLEPKKQLEYEQWCKESGSMNFLFSKKTKKQVTTIRKNCDVSKIKDFLFSVHVTFSTEPSRLGIKSATGPQQRLVILKGEPVTSSDVPEVLDTGLHEDALNHLHENEENESNDEGENEELNFQAPPHGEFGEDTGEGQEETSDHEILADSDDEEMWQALLSNKHSRVKSFHHREAYRKLDERGLADIPPVKGCTLVYHSTSMQWQGYYPSVSSGLSCTWGGVSKRSEAEALLKVIMAIVRAHVEKCPKEKLWLRQLEKLKNAEATVFSF